MQRDEETTRVDGKGLVQNFVHVNLYGKHCKKAEAHYRRKVIIIIILTGYPFSRSCSLQLLDLNNSLSSFTLYSFILSFTRFINSLFLDFFLSRLLFSCFTFSFYFLSLNFCMLLTFLVKLILLCKHLIHSSTSGRIWDKVNFLCSKAGFLLINWLHEDERTQSVLLLSHSWEKEEMDSCLFQGY